MKVTTFDFVFDFRNRKYKASCQKFQVHQYPQYRVVVDLEKKEADIYTLYEVNEGKYKFFWFKLPDKREDFAKVIARALEQRDKAK